MNESVGIIGKMAFPNRPKHQGSVALRKSNFESLLLESIDQALADLFGTRARDQLYDFIVINYGYGREQIPSRLEDFYDFLENIFGPSCRTLGRTIIRRLYGKLGYEFWSVPCFGFFDYLDAVRMRFERDRPRLGDVGG